jgi:hypothetical protein
MPLDGSRPLHQLRMFAGVEIAPVEGLKPTHNGHSSLLMRTSAIGSQNGRSIAATS